MPLAAGEGSVQMIKKTPRWCAGMQQDVTACIPPPMVLAR